MSNKSRAERFSDALGQIEQAKGEIETLKDELENWKDSIPENLQGGQKYSDLEDAISNLEEAIEACDTATSTDVSFPGMFG